MYGTTGTLTVGTLAAVFAATSGASARIGVGATLGAHGLPPSALPSTGAGGMALAVSSQYPWLLSLGVVLVALWSLLMVGRVLLAMWPKAES